MLYQSSFNFLVTGGGGGYSTFSCTRNAESSTTASRVDPSSIHVIQSWLLQLPCLMVSGGSASAMARAISGGKVAGPRCRVQEEFSQCSRFTEIRGNQHADCRHMQLATS